MHTRSSKQREVAIENDFAKRLRSRRDEEKNFIANRILNPWNKLKNAIVNAPTTNCFKNRVQKCCYNKSKSWNIILIKMNFDLFYFYLHFIRLSFRNFK